MCLILLNLFEPEEALYEIDVRFVNGTVFSEGTFALFRLFGENVAFKRLLMRDLSRAGYLEPLFCARVSFNFWHFLYVNFYTLLAFRTGGHLWSLVGNHYSACTVNETGGKTTKKNEKSREYGFIPP